jgi:hypothetical protein
VRGNLPSFRDKRIRSFLSDRRRVNCRQMAGRSSSSESIISAEARSNFASLRVEANQRVGASEYPMQVVTFEMLQQEEKNRQVASAILIGVAGAANAYSASRAGYGSYTTPSGRTGTFYSPTAAVIAQNNAAVQNEAMFAAIVERGQQNMVQLEQAVIKDNTLMPGEWYGGQLHLAPPTDQGGGQKAYSIVIMVGSDRHVIEVAQGPAGS